MTTRTQEIFLGRSLNDVKAARLPIETGDTEPEPKEQGLIWLDTSGTRNVLKFWKGDAANGEWLTVGVPGGWSGNQISRGDGDDQIQGSLCDIDDTGKLSVGTDLEVSGNFDLSGHVVRPLDMNSNNITNVGTVDGRPERKLVKQGCPILGRPAEMPFQRIEDDRGPVGVAA